MFERFTESSIKVIILAQEEARRLGHNRVGSEQILLGIIGLDKGASTQELKSMGVTLARAREEVENIIGRGSDRMEIEIPFTPNAKKLLEQSWEESKTLSGKFIDSEHLLLAITTLGEGVAVQVLTKLRVDLAVLRQRIQTSLEKSSPWPVRIHPLDLPSDTEAPGPMAVDDLSLFSQGSIKVLRLAQDATLRLGHTSIGTEQILLGLLADSTGLPATILNLIGLNKRNVQIELEKIIGRGSGFVTIPVPLTPRAKKILEGAWTYAQELKQNPIGPEHLLLSLLDESGGVAYQIFNNLDVDIADLRKKVLESLSGS